MNRLNESELIEKLKNVFKDVSDFAFFKDGYIDDEIGYTEEIHQYGGEGQGNRWESVKYFKDHDIYLKIRGYYMSYDGTDFPDEWECVFAVRPQEKTITVYE